MHLNRHHLNNTKIALCLVLFVVLVCSGQHAGILQSCASSNASKNANADIAFIDAGETMSQRADITSHTQKNTENDSGCSLAEKLLQHHQQQIAQAILSSLLLLLVIALVASPPLSFPITTEPIPPTRRRHLTLCVFRE